MAGHDKFEFKADDDGIEFGPFGYDPVRKLLFSGGELVPLGGPESALLDMLLQRPGALVTKEALAAAMWPERTVAECNLRWQVASLRRRIGCGRDMRYLATVSGRGYRFVAPVRYGEDAHARRGGITGEGAPLPSLPARIFGRERELAELRRVVGAHRLLSVVGPGGIGKTTVALAVAHEWRRDTAARVLFVDLSGHGAGDDAASAIAAALGLQLLVPDMLDALAAHLRSKRLLLLLDSCEGIGPQIALLAGRLLRDADEVIILATGHEPLGCLGEHVVRLGPLGLPPAGTKVSLATLRSHGATALFLERLEQGDRGADPVGPRVQPEDAESIRRICERLDGHALAVELAAGQAGALGIAGLAGLLDDRLLLAMSDGAERSPRHRTLALAFGWSYDRLSPDEQYLLRRISRFGGRFEIAAAVFVTEEPALHGVPPAVLLAGLVRKSFVVAENCAEGMRYRLLDPVRAFAAERLVAAGDADEAAARHAAYLLEALHAPEDAAALGDMPRNIADALDWAEADEARRGIAAALTLAAAPLWNALSMLGECVSRTRRAIASAERAGIDGIDLCALYEVLVGALAATGGHEADLAAASERLCGLAVTYDRRDAKLKGLWGRWVERLNGDSARAARKLAEMFGEEARQSNLPAMVVTADRLLGMSLHLEGAQRAALALLDSTLPIFAWPERDRANLPYHFDQRIVVLAYRARATLLAGDVEQALRMAAAAGAEAEDMGHPSSTALALAIGQLPVALLAGQLDLALRLVSRLRILVDEAGIPSWKTIASGLEGWVHAATGRATITDINRALAHVHRVVFGPTHMAALAALASAAGAVGHPEAGLDIVTAALAVCGRTGTRWCEPELLRVQAELLVASKARAALGEAHALLDRAEALAGAQGASLWSDRIRESRPAFAD